MKVWIVLSAEKNYLMTSNKITYSLKLKIMFILLVIATGVKPL